MLSSNLKLLGKYSHLSEKFQQGLTWLAQSDIASLPDGKHKIPDTDLTADIQSYDSKVQEQCRFESHHSHFDIQYVAEGREFFGVCNVDGLTVTEAHPERDTYFYGRPENFGCVLLNKGDFIIVSPEEAHMAKCAVEGKPGKVRKVVIKVEC